MCRLIIRKLLEVCSKFYGNMFDAHAQSGICLWLTEGILELKFRYLFIYAPVKNVIYF